MGRPCPAPGRARRTHRRALQPTVRQTILLAVHPTPGQQWSSAVVADVVVETLELAKIRLVDLQAVAWAGRFLPGAYVPDGDVPGALTLDFKQLVEHWHATGVLEP